MARSGHTGGEFESSQVIPAARARTKQQLGSALEEKATDRFCLTFAASRTPTLFAGAEAAPQLGLPAEADVPAIIEFSEREEALGLPDHIERDAASQVWERLGDVVEELPQSEKALALLLRLAGVKATKDEFLRQAGPIRDELDRTVAALAARTRRPSIPGQEAARPGVQACWLNRTVRAIADPQALTEVVADPRVRRLDVPRPLEPDQLEADVTLDAAARLRTAEGFSGRGVTVGVIDSEVALGHPAFQDRVIHQQNFTSEPFGIPGAHGTAVAGFVGANSDTFQGMAPECTIYNYKVLATVPTLGADDFEGALAIQQALEDGVRVVNCSWGAGPAGDGTSREARACDTAWGLGLTIVKSAGNRGPGDRTLTTPADAEGVIVVGATNREGDALQDYSSRGPTSDGRDRPHLLAPGGSPSEGLVSALVGGGFGDVGHGTSYAAPHIAGLLALLLEREPELTPTEQRASVRDACTPLPGVDPALQGAGLISPEALFG